MVSKTVLVAAASIPLLCVSVAPAQANNVQTTMPVTATNLSSCAVAALPLAFASLNQINGSVTDSQSTITVTCTTGVVYNVGLDLGAHAAGSLRQMQATLGTSMIPYALYSDSTRTTAWGNTVGTDTVARTAGVLPAALSVYGRIPAGTTNVPSGAYADLVTVTVTF